MTEFNENNHCVAAGVASWLPDRWLCRLFGHSWPKEHAGPRDGYSPHDVVRCRRGCFGKWYVVGQHRYGSLNDESLRRAAATQLKRTTND